MGFHRTRGCNVAVGVVLLAGRPGSFAAIFISIRYWKRPGSLVPRTKWRFIAAILIGLAEISFFTLVVYTLTQTARARAL